MKIGDEVIVIEDVIVGGHAFFKAGEVTIIQGIGAFEGRVILHLKFSEYGSMTAPMSKVVPLNEENFCKFVVEKMEVA